MVGMLTLRFQLLETSRLVQIQAILGDATFSGDIWLGKKRRMKLHEPKLAPRMLLGR